MFRWIRELSQRNTWHLSKSNQCFQRVLVWKMSGEHCSPLDIAKSDAATNVKMSRRIGLREWQKSGSWAESCELFSRESRDVLSVRCRKYLLVEYASSTVDYLWNMVYTIYILFFFGTENRCNISRTLIGCIKRIYNIYNYCINSTKLSFNIYIYTIQFLDIQNWKNQDIYILFISQFHSPLYRKYYINFNQSIKLR